MDYFRDPHARWPAVLVWGGAWWLMLRMDGLLSLGNLALLQVMGGAVAALWLSPLGSLLFSVSSVALFNFLFVDPRLSFVALLHEDLLLLVTLLGVCTGISYLLSHLRRQAFEREQALLAERRARDEMQDKDLRNTLLTAISHDYRTPLATIIGAASSLAEHARSADTERIRESARTILEEAGHLSQMTANTLQLARLDAERVSIRREWESLEEILGSVLARARRTSGGRQLRADIPRSLPLLRCDATLLVQLFDNLIDNAFKYSPAGSAVTLRVLRQAQSLEVQVIDAGSGIPDAWKERVFDAFQRIDEGHPADAGSGNVPRRGVGVGLAVCRAIARAHGATIVAADAMPHGSVFSVTLPVGTQPVLPPEHAEEVA